jgi:hypothetical protein
MFSTTTAWLKGFGLGAGLMYLFDPNAGPRRRALLADRVRGLVNDLGDFVDAGTRDLRNRALGLVAETQAQFRPGEADDRTVAERVRATLGRCVSHPRAIAVESREGRVTLRGPILAAEADRLLRAVADVRGVRAVDNQLEPHQHAGDHPALQGGEWQPAEPSGVLPWNITPASGLILGTAGTALGLCAIRRAGLMLPALAFAGAAYAMSRTTGDPLRALPGWVGDPFRRAEEQGGERGRGVEGQESGPLATHMPEHGGRATGHSGTATGHGDTAGAGVREREDQGRQGGGRGAGNGGTAVGSSRSAMTNVRGGPNEPGRAGPSGTERQPPSKTGTPPGGA